MEDIKKILSSLLGETVKKKGIYEALKEILGEDYIKHVKNAKINRKKILIFVDSPSWAQEMSLKKKKILEEIIKDREFSEIKEILVLVGG